MNFMVNYNIALQSCNSSLRLMGGDLSDQRLARPGYANVYRMTIGV